MADASVPEADSAHSRSAAEQRLPLREVQKQLTRERVIDAAMEVFGERGFGPTTMNDIAARANLNRGTIYLHFADKSGIIHAALDALAPEELAIYAAAETATTRSELETIMDHAVEVWVTGLGRIWRHMRDAVALDPAVRNWRDEFVDRQVLRVCEVLEHFGVQPYERRYARSLLLVCMWNDFVANVCDRTTADRRATVAALADFFFAATGATVSDELP
ncbi:TetR/AcrR family transcriptional regulator [Mycobacterium sp. HM-7]